jgi:hypothetical protein
MSALVLAQNLNYAKLIPCWRKRKVIDDMAKQHLAHQRATKLQIFAPMTSDLIDLNEVGTNR